jgi:hypothetical protein
MSCFCGHTHTSFAKALACSKRLQGAGSPLQGTYPQTLGGRSVSPHRDSMSREEIPVTSRLMGRRITPVGVLARDRARATGEGLLRTSPRGGRPPLSPEERRGRARDRKRRERAAKKARSAATSGVGP